MKKTIALFSSLLILAGARSKAQTPSQVPVKKETTKPATDTALDPKSLNPTFAKGVKPAFSKGSNPTFAKGSNSTPVSASSSTNISVVPRHVPPPPNQSVVPHHKG